jgi:GT2 family glycosyltransferase
MSVSAARVTAVVLNWCNEHDTKACVDSLEAQDYPALTILVVDNGSPDGSGERLHARYPDAQYLQTGQNLGYAGGNNSGMRRALEQGAEFVLVLNNDAVLDETCVSELVRAAQSNMNAGAVGPKILRYDSPERIWFAGGRFDQVRAAGIHLQENMIDADPRESQVAENTFLTGCCILIPAATIESVGYFRDDFFTYMEDVEYSFRIMASGAKLLYAPAARLKHRVPPWGTEPSGAQIRYRDRNRRRMVRTHYGNGDAALFAIWFYPTRVLLMLRYALRGEMERARGIWQGMTLA